MSLEDRLFEQRYQKIRDIEALGFEAYPRKFTFSHTAREIHSTYGALDGEQLESKNVQTKVCGRLMTVRRQGKAGFCHIQQEGERLQLYVRQDTVGEKAFALYKKLDAGDIIGAEGSLFRTRTGELTCAPSVWSSWPKQSCRCPKSGTVCKTSRFGIGSVIWISSPTRKSAEFSYSATS